MHVNYIALMLINLAAGMFLLAYYVVRGLERPEGRGWIPAFALVGGLGLATGLHMVLVWPVPGAYNIVFGDMATWFAALLLAGVVALAVGWPLVPLGIVALLAGLAAIVVGIRIMDLGMTLQPTVAGLGFIVSGLAGVLALPVLVLRGLPQLRSVMVVLLVVAGLIWAFLGYMAYWSHPAEYSDWQLTPAQRLQTLN